MSRLETSCYSPEEAENGIPCLLVTDAEQEKFGTHDETPITFQEFARAQCEDLWIEKNQALLRTSDDGLWVRPSELDENSPTVVPNALIPRVLRIAHNSIMAGHPGAQRLYKTLRKSFYWPRMIMDCYEHVRSCVSCSKKQLRTRTKTTFLKLFPPSRPLEFVGIDLLGPLPKTRRGNLYLLVITDRFSKWTRAIAMSETTAPDVAIRFFADWCSIFGAPLMLLSVNGPQFRARMFQSFCLALGIKQLFTTPYHPNTNGQTERFNRTLLDMMIHFVADHQTDWDLVAPFANLAYNQTVHSSTKLAPMELIIPSATRNMILADTESFDVPKNTSPLAYRQAVLRLAERHGRALRETNTARQKRYKQDYDKRVRERNKEISIGDKVFLKTFDLSSSRSPKLSFPASGPHVVIGIDDSRHTYTLQMPAGQLKFPSNHIVRCPDDELVPPEEDQAHTHHDPQEQEFVIERLLGHRQKDNETYVRVRWAGFSREDDTWELVRNIPREFVERYARKKRIQVSHLLSPTRTENSS